MADNSVNAILEKFTALSDEYKAIESESKTDLKEYTDYCDSSDVDLAKKLEEIREKIAKTEEYMDYAKKHAADVEEAVIAIDMEMYELEDIKHQIDENSTNDYHAETLYTKASGLKKTYEAEMERTNKKISGSKVQAKRLYDSQMGELTARREKNIAQFREYTATEEFKGYIKHLSTDAAAFNSSGRGELPENPEISLGQRRVRLPVPAEFDEELSLMTGGVFNSAAKTIGVPYSLEIKNGKVVYIDYEQRNETYLLGGVQRFVLNILKYYEQTVKGVFVADPVKFSSDILGNIAGLSRTVNPIIEPIPANAEALLEKLKEYKQKLSKDDPIGANYVFVFHSFPESYDDETRAEILDLVSCAEKYKVTVVLTHKVPAEEVPPKDAAAENAVRSHAESIRAKNGGFYVEATHDTLFWYSSPSDIPDDVRRTYIEHRRRAAEAEAASAVAPVEALVSEPAPVPAAQPAVQPAAQPAAEPTKAAEEAPSVPESEPAPAEATPAANEAPAETSEPAPKKKLFDKSKKGGIVFTYGTDISDKKQSFNFEDFGSVGFICGTKRAGRTSLLRTVADKYIAEVHPDNAELWLIDFEGNEFTDYADPCAPHIKYLMLGGTSELAYSVVDTLSEAVEKRAEAFGGKWNSFADVPADVYMPEIIVILEAFDTMAKALSQSPAYAEKYRSLLKACGKYGVRILMAADTYTDGGNVAPYLSDTLGFVMAMSSADPAPTTIFKDIQLTAEEIISVASIPEHHAFMKLPAPEHGTYLKFAKLAVPKDSEAVKSAAKSALSLEVSDSFSPSDSDSFLSKKTIIKSISAKREYDKVAESISEQLGAKAEDTQMYFLGSSGSMREDHAIVLSKRFGQNILLESGVNFRTAADIVISAVRSAALQDVSCCVLAAEGSEVLDIAAGCEKLSVSPETDLGAVCKKIDEMKADVVSGKSADSLTVILGAELLLAEMATLGSEVLPDGRRDAARDLILVLSQGAKLGMHFLVQFSEQGSTETEKLVRSTLRNVVTVTEARAEFSFGTRRETFTPYSNIPEEKSVL